METELQDCQRQQVAQAGHSDRDSDSSKHGNVPVAHLPPDVISQASPDKAADHLDRAATEEKNEGAASQCRR